MRQNFIIIPKIISKYKDQYEYSIEISLIKFLNYCFKNCKIKIFTKNQKYKKNDIFILSGGNNILKFSKNKSDLLRNQLDEIAYKTAVKNKSKIIGICHGAHFIASKNKAKINKIKRHTQSHIVELGGKKIKVNSFHNYGIFKVNFNDEVKAVAQDGSIEMFLNLKKKYIGIMWHPERNRKFRKIDKQIFNNFICN